MPYFLAILVTGVPASRSALSFSRKAISSLPERREAGAAVVLPAVGLVFTDWPAFWISPWAMLTILFSSAISLEERGKTWLLSMLEFQFV